MPQAARLYDPIGHSPTMNWLLRGAVIGAAIGLATVAIVGTGGLAAVAVIGGLVAGGAGIGEMLSTMSWAAKEVTGKIVGLCSGNVFTNGKRAARAHVDMAACTKHPPLPLPIATGSGNVYINGQPAARVGDTIACSAVITDGSANVYIGGGSQRTDTISPEDLVPPLVHTAMLVVGIGAAVVLAGPIVAVAGLALGAAIGALGGWAGGQVFGEGSDGQKWSMLGGGLIGGLVGSKGGSVLAAKFIPKPTTPVGGFVKGGLPRMKEADAQDRLDKSLGENSGVIAYSADGVMVDSFGRTVSARTQGILDRFKNARRVTVVDERGREISVSIVEGLARREVKVSDLGRLQAATGNEFSLLRGPDGQRVLLQGQMNELAIPGNYVGAGWKWSGHSHPYSVTPSSADRQVLQAFGQQHSVIKSAATGQEESFAQYEDWSNWLPGSK